MGRNLKLTILFIFLSGGALNAVEVENARQIAHRWAYPAYVPGDNYAAVFKSGIDKEAAYARRAASYYEEARQQDLIYAEKKKLVDSVIESNRLWLRNPVWYKALEENQAIRNLFGRISRKHHLDQAQKYYKAFMTLSDQANRKDELYYSSLRMHITHSVAAGSFEQATQSLNRYETRQGADNEWPYHYYRFVCELYRYKLMQKSTAVKETRKVESARKLREALLSAVSLRYTADSIEYRTALQYANRNFPVLY